MDDLVVQALSQLMAGEVRRGELQRGHRALENRLVIESLPDIRQVRATRTLPDVPVVVLSATTGRPEEERQMWTGFHAQRAASVPRGRHIVLADTSHGINQERPAEIADAISHILDDI
jgi:pimeloyl-ACP methyl ester carboxylesterase